MPTQAQLDRLLEKARATNTSTLVVMQRGQVLLDEVCDGRGRRPLETMSVTKAVLSLLVGRAVTLAYLPGPDVPICTFYPEWAQGQKKHITLRHLLTHTSGLQNVPAAPEEIYPSPDFVQLALCAELSHAPGTTFAYNNKAVNLICGVLERATGQKADDFAALELFGPLGITEWHWTRDRAGHPHGMSGLALTGGDLARLGELARAGGGSLISAAWLNDSIQPATTVTQRMGLLWALWHAQARYEITADHVEAVGASGAPGPAKALVQLQGNHSRSALTTLMRQFHFDPSQVPSGVQWFKECLGPRTGFCHDGWLGQYLAVHEEAQLVAVRQVAWDHPEAQTPVTGWPDFLERVEDLARTD